MMQLQLLLLFLILHVVFALRVKAQTQVGFYDKTCPNAEAIVKQTVQIHMQSDVTVAAGLLRLHFHDCFIQGCDGSILLNGPGTEKTAPANLGLRGFDVVDDAKAQLEAVCPGMVSCADILALAAKDAVDLSGGPTWRVPLGRRDGRVSRAADAANMPSPLDTIPVLKQKFAAKGLNAEDLVVLNGAHTIGQTDCRFFSYRLYNYSAVSGQSDPSINRDFLSALQELCPASGNGLARVALDRGSQTTFDTSFFKNVNKGYGVLESDQRLMSDDTTALYVKRYGGLISGLLGVRFDLAFASSMQRMGNVDVKVGSQGEIRKVCSAVN